MVNLSLPVDFEIQLLYYSNMGKCMSAPESPQRSKTTISIATLNYSGILLSPFEFYGLDNWEELQHIGLIFETQLKQSYRSIKEQRQKLDNSKKQDEQFSIKTFKWEVGDIDKAVHVERYTPLYTSEENIRAQRFAGISETNQIMSANQFQEKWDKTFSSLPQKDDKDFQKGRKANKVEKFNCRTFDLLCYKSIIYYLYTKNIPTRHPNFESVMGDKKNHQILLPIYKKFMKDYFSRIDKNGKIRITMQSLFQKKIKPEIVCFQEGTPQLRCQLEKLQDYHIYGSEKNNTNQTILMIHKHLCFVPNQHSQNHLIDNPEQTKKKIGEDINNYLESFKKFWEEQFDKKEKSKKDFDKKVQAKQFFFENLKKDINYWIESSTIVNYPKDKILLGSFHLSSKGEINPLQVQLLGLVISLWEKKGYKIIFAGDFNSHITTSDKQPLNLFSFANLQKYQPKNIQIFPSDLKVVTTKKKRTFLQVQFHKVNDLAQKSLDQVITNFEILERQSHVFQIKDVGLQKNNNQSYLPHKDHPYDHSLVYVNLNLGVDASK